MSGLAVCTALAGNYLAYGAVLAASFRRFHPDVPFYLLLGNGPSPRELARDAGVTILRLRDLRVPGLWRMLLLRYDRKQTMVAMKPALLRAVLDRGHRSAIFLDPDMFVTATLAPVMDIVASHALTLTPHVTPAFASAGRTALERNLLLAGTYNGGFVGVSDREEARRFLAWWEGRLRTHCLDRVQEGIHYDQRWLDLAPGFVGDVGLLRDPGCNAAYWNLPELRVRRVPEGYLVDGEPLRLFHFSGFRPTEPDAVSVYAPGWRVSGTGAAADLFGQYAALLTEAGWADAIRRPWPWDGIRWRYKAVAAKLARLGRGRAARGRGRSPAPPRLG